MSRKSNTTATQATFRPVTRDEGAIIEDIVAQIRDFLRDGQYQPGDPLPGEREMAAQLGVSRNTLRGALNTLSMMGVLETRHGSRTRIAPDGSRVLERAFEFLTLLDLPTYKQIHHARQVMEVHLAGEAAKNRTSGDLARMRTALDDIYTAYAEIPFDPIKAGNANYHFHQTVAHAAHNPILERVLSSLHSARKAFFLSITTAGSGRPEYNEVHERLYEAICDRDAEAACRAMAMDMHISLDVLEFIQQRARTEDEPKILV